MIEPLTSYPEATTCLYKGKWKQLARAVASVLPQEAHLSGSWNHESLISQCPLFLNNQNCWRKYNIWQKIFICPDKFNKNLYFWPFWGHFVSDFRNTQTPLCPLSADVSICLIPPPPFVSPHSAADIICEQPLTSGQTFPYIQAKAAIIHSLGPLKRQYKEYMTKSFSMIIVRSRYFVLEDILFFPREEIMSFTAS